VAARSTIKLWIRQLLGTSSDDPRYADATLDPIVQQAYDSLIWAAFVQNPDYLVAATITLTADATDSLVYTFATQSTAVTDFAGWLEVRYLDKDGLALTECRSEDLNEVGTDFFVITGPDESAVLTLSDGSPTGTDLYFRYRAWPASLVDDNSVPVGLPSRFHDVLALESLFAYGLGGEQRLPPELGARWLDRKTQMLSHIGKRGIQPTQTRIMQPLFDD